MSQQARRERSLQFEFFDRFVPEYQPERIQFVVDRLASTKRRSDGGPLRVIDVGCGDGACLRYLQGAVSALEPFGLDPSSSYVERAHELGLANVRVGSVLDAVPVDERGRYDAVLLVSVLHHLVGTSRRRSTEYARAAVRNCLSMLNHTGALFVFEPTREPQWLVTAVFHVKRLAIRLFGNRRIHLGPSWANIGAPLVSFFQTQKLHRMLEECGGAVDDVVVVDENSFGGFLTNRRVGYVVRHPDALTTPLSGGAS